jgi:hypothetical protein
LQSLTKFASQGFSGLWRWGLAVWLAGFWLALLAISPSTSLANGGTLIFSGDTGPFNVNLLISPSPPTPSVPAHFTMILTKKSSDQPVTTATITVEPEMPGMAMPGMVGTRFIQSPARPNQYDVDVPVTMEGMWRFNIRVIDPQLGSTSFTADAKVEKPDAPWAVIIAILIGLPVLAGMTWFFLFRGQKDDDDEDEDDEGDKGKGPAEVKVGT